MLLLFMMKLRGQFHCGTSGSFFFVDDLAISFKKRILLTDVYIGGQKAGVTLDKSILTLIFLH